MKKSIIYIATLVIIVFVSFWIYDANHVTKKEYANLIKNHPVQQRLQLSKKERKKYGIPPNRYFDDQFLLEMDPKTGKTYPENLERIKSKNKNRVLTNAVPGQNSAMAWEERGPNNIGGRTRVVFYDPNDANGTRVFAGGVSGGLWVNNDITDSNSSWTRVGIDENLPISCIAIDPNNSNVWYIGTGESFTESDGVGNGIWRTLNGGATWENFLGIDLGLANGDRPYYVNQIVVWNLNGASRLFVSIDGGFDEDFVGFNVSGWWSLQDNALKRIPFFNVENTPYVFSDVEIAKDNSLWLATKSNIYGHGGGKVFRSTDGVNFTEKYSFTNGGRVELTTSKVNANTVYALGSIDEFGFNNTSVEMVKTNDGTNFTSISLPNDEDTSISADDFARGQGFYNLTIEVNPENDDVLYAGGIDLFRSVNGGSSWQQISKWIDSSALGLDDLQVSEVHADQHAIFFDPNNTNKAVIANDGGVYYSSNLSSAASNVNAIKSRNNGYNITQFYSSAIGQSTTEEMLLGGAQDNGSLLAATIVNNSLDFSAVNGENTFIDIFGGDGVECFIDKDGEYLITSFVHNFYGAYPIPFTNNDDLVDISTDQSTGQFANESDLDDNLDILYTDGSTNFSYRISRFTNLLTNPIRKNFTDSSLSEIPRAIKVSPFTTSSSTVFVGTEGATVLKVTNMDTDTPNWTNIDSDGEINIGTISDIDFGNNEDEIIVTLHNYGINNIYYTTNGGEDWVVKDGDFPDIPVKAVKINPLNSNEVIIGTNLGVWKTDNFLDNDVSWTQSYNGMSNVRVTKFDYRTADNTVIASTYGRGLFTGQFTSTTESSDGNIYTNPILDFNSTDIFDTSKDSDTLFSESIDFQELIVLRSNIVQNQVIEFEWIEGMTGTAQITLLNALGQIVYNRNDVSLGVKSQSIPVPFINGVYYLKISTSDFNITKEIIINN